MAGRTVTVTFAGDEKKLSRTMDRVEKKAGKVTGAFGKMGSALGGVAKIAGGFVLAQGILKAPEIIGAATARFQDLQLQGRKAERVFGDLTDQAKAMAKELGPAFGDSSNEVLRLLANTQDLLVPMGFTRDSAFDITEQLGRLTPALVEWSGGTRSATDVAETLQAALLGERERLKSLGISIKEADVQQRLLEKGQKSLTGQALEQAKAQATLELIMEKSGDAQLQYAQNSDTAARKQAAFNARIAEMKDKVVLGVVPALLNLQDAFFTKVVPGIVMAGDAMREKLAPHIEDFTEFAKTNLIPAT